MPVTLTGEAIVYLCKEKCRYPTLSMAGGEEEKRREEKREEERER